MNPQRKPRMVAAIGAYSALAILAAATLDGKLRLAVLLLLAAFAFKTWIALTRPE